MLNYQRVEPEPPLPPRLRHTDFSPLLIFTGTISSDKTGTLTQNIMTFNKCAIAGRSYGDIIDEKTGEPIDVDEVRKVDGYISVFPRL